MRLVEGMEYNWDELKQRNRWTWIFFIGLFVVAGSIGMLLTHLFDSEIPAAALAFGWMGIFIFNTLRIAPFRCPRCQKPFFGGWLRRTGFARHCLHCGLRKYAKDDGEKSALT